MKIDLPAFGAGGLLSAVMLYIGTVTGLWIKRSTAVKVHNIDDRTKLTQDTMRQLDVVQKWSQYYEKHAQFLSRGNALMERTVTNIGAETRVLRGRLEGLITDLEAGVPDLPDIRRQADSALFSLERIESIIRKDGERLEKECGQAPDPPQVQPISPPEKDRKDSVGRSGDE